MSSATIMDRPRTIPSERSKPLRGSSGRMNASAIVAGIPQRMSPKLVAYMRPFHHGSGIELGFSSRSFTGEVRSRLTTPSSATAERGAVAAGWSEEGAYKLRPKVARRRRVQARVSSYRDARSSSLQRMVRRRWVRRRPHWFSSVCQHTCQRMRFGPFRAGPRSR